MSFFCQYERKEILEKEKVAQKYFAKTLIRAQ